MPPKESDLDLAFATAVEQSPRFRTWLLERTKFRHLASSARLLSEEQGRNRPVWWKHWWCFVPETGEERETDVFLVFEDGPAGDRFALHVENKLANGKFLAGQAEGYEPRARFMANQERFLSYQDFATILIAPTDFRNANLSLASFFDAFIAYEELAEWISDFRTEGSSGSGS